MREKIQAEIDSARERLRALDLERAGLTARIDTLLEMLELAPSETKPRRRQAVRGRSLSDEWRKILYMMATEKGESGANYDDIYEMATRAGVNVKKENLRGHMGNYKTAGYVESVKAGVFVVTKDGWRQAKSAKSKEPGECSPGPDNPGAVTGRGAGFPSGTPSGSIPDASTHIPPEVEDVFDTKPSSMDDEIPF